LSQKWPRLQVSVSGGAKVAQGGPKYLQGGQLPPLPPTSRAYGDDYLCLVLSGFEQEVGCEFAVISEIGILLYNITAYNLLLLYDVILFNNIPILFQNMLKILITVIL